MASKKICDRPLFVLVLEFMNPWELLKMQAAHRKSYEHFVPQIMVKIGLNVGQRLRVKKMLATEPNNVSVPCLESWKKLGPLTIWDFENAALRFGLPAPEFDDEKTQYSIKEPTIYGNNYPIWLFG